MGTLWLFISVGAVIALFWFSRLVAESAKSHAQNQADKLNVQLLSVACQRFRIGVLKSGVLGIKSEFLFEFSSDGESLYQGTLHLENTKLVKADIPVYRTN